MNTLCRSLIRSFSFSANARIGIPFVIDSDGRTERVYDIYSRLLKDRIVCVMGPIDDNYASLVIAQLLFLQSESGKKPISLYINCPGGSVTAGLGIYDTMQHISAPVATWCIGQASSMGSLLLGAGANGKRTSLPNARIMVHQPSGGASGTAADVLIRAEEINRLRRRINEIYAMHTGQAVEKIDEALDRYTSSLQLFELFDLFTFPALKPFGTRTSTGSGKFRDRFMSAQEAKEFGLIDKVETHTGSMPIS